MSRHPRHYRREIVHVSRLRCGCTKTRDNLWVGRAELSTQDSARPYGAGALRPGDTFQCATVRD
jgi:hypothetical protein